MTATFTKPADVGLHDLRNALSTIQMCASALMEAAPASERDVRHVGELIQRSAAWMQQIVQERLEPALTEGAPARSA